jgi:nucleotide-binding universal stress UspA family protein
MTLTRQNSEEKTRIVVGCDLRPTADEALWQALQLARQLQNAELHVTHVIVTSKDLHDARTLDQLVHDVPTTMEKLRAHVLAVCAQPAHEAAFQCECVLHVRLGQPAPALHQVAVDVDANLIVVGTRGRTRVEELITGSVGQELLHMAKVSVLVAHPQALAGLAKSAHLEPRRAGQALYDQHLDSRVHLEFVPRTAHISGLL